MKRLVASLVLVGVLLPRAAAGQTRPLADIPPGDDRIVPVTKGVPAPFDGQLFDTPTALRWANWLEQYRIRLKLDVETAQRLAELETSLLNEKLDLERAQYKQVTEELNKRVSVLQEELRNPPWYKTTWFGIALGVTGSFALVGATAWIVGSTR
jgi:hypothetical protein